MLRPVADVPRTEQAAARAGGWKRGPGALRTERDELNTRVAELAGHVAALQKSLTTLTGVAFGSSEKSGSPSRERLEWRKSSSRAGKPGVAGRAW
jgi:hypothetical protein